MSEQEKKNAEQLADHAQNGALVRKLVGVGAAWARYGLTIGRAALETSAETLRTTSSILGDVADQIDARAAADREPKPAA